jgi:hypothetical protein
MAAQGCQFEPEAFTVQARAARLPRSTQPPPFGGFNMPARRLFNGVAKSPLDPLCLTTDDLLARLQAKTGLQDLILQNNRDHLISGKAYNTAGYVLQLIEHLGRKCTTGEVVAASDGELTDRSVLASIGKINGIIYALAGLTFTLIKDTGEIRLVNDSDALMATEKFANKFLKVREEFVRTATAYEQATGKPIGPVLQQIDQQLLAEGKKNESTFAALGRVLAPAHEETAA